MGPNPCRARVTLARCSLALAACLIALVAPPARAGDELLRAGDRVCLVGPALVERLQHHGWLETRIATAAPGFGLSFRNLGFASDELTVAQRTAGFGDQDSWLDRCDASVVFAFVGQMESFAGPDGVEAFRDDLVNWIQHVTTTTYDDAEPPRVLLLTPPPVEDLSDPLLPDPEAGDARLAPYVQVMREVAEKGRIPLVDLFTLMVEPLAGPDDLTHDGVHFTEAGNAVLADVIATALLGAAPPASLSDQPRRSAVREAVLEKNKLWFNRYRATDGYNVYGGRSSLTYDGVTNYDVLQRELHHIDALCENLDARIGALAAGEELASARSVPVPPLMTVETNRPGPLPGGRYSFQSGEEAIASLTVGEGLEVSLFADESRFPELANPVQMAFDTQGRLWVAVWPTYPHWVPGEPMNDKLVIVHDDDGDGSADRTTLFADDLHNPTGFEFWNGGVFVAQAPDLWFLKDTDGDDVADVRERVLHGLSSADTHHGANSFVLAPDGALYFQEGTFHMSQVESIHGPVRNFNGCVWRYEPRTRRVERHVPYNFANPHGHVFDRWGTEFVTDGTGNVNYLAQPFSGRVLHPQKKGGYFPFFNQRSRPAGGTEILSSAHLPDDFRDDYVIANVIGFQGIFRYDVLRDGSGRTAEEAEPILFSSDPNFRPVDLETGPDGALWLLDWQNPLIGHMQHHLRDPNRDGTHGRVYRVTAKGRPLSQSPPIAGAPTDDLVPLLAHPEDRVRYRARIELSARDSLEVVAAARAWAAGLEGSGAEHERLLTEALWLQQQHVVLDEPLLHRLLSSPEPLARAAAATTVRRMREHLDDPVDLLAPRVGDPDSQVRLAAVVALSEFDDPRAAELALSALSTKTDRFLEYAIAETLKVLAPVWHGALASGAPFADDDPLGLAWALERLTPEELASARPLAAVFRERLARPSTDTAGLLDAARGLSALTDATSAQELLAAIDRADAREGGHVDHLLSNLFAALNELPRIDLDAVASGLRDRSAQALRASTRKLATVARLRADGDVAPAWNAALGSVGTLVDLLAAAPRVGDDALASELFERTLPLLDGPPPQLAAEAGQRGTRGRFVRIELPGNARTLTLAEVQVLSRGNNVALDGTATQSSTNWGGLASRAIDGITSGRYGDNGQTHTNENQPDTWWEADLGAEHDLDAVVVWNRTESGGSYVSRLDGYVLSVLDGERRTVWRETAGPAQSGPVSHPLASPAARLRRQAVLCLGELGVRTDEALAALTPRFDDPDLRPSVVTALQAIPADRWNESAADAMGLRLASLLNAAPPGSLDGELGSRLLGLADHVASSLGPEDATSLRRLARRHGAQVITLRPVRDALLFDRAEFSVVAGHPVELRFDNTDVMPHNVVVTAPGALTLVGLAGEAMASDPGAWDAGFVPSLPEVLFATGLVQPGLSETLAFDAPDDEGEHPYVCTFPGHWIRMNGVMHVVASWEELEAAEQSGSVATTPAEEQADDAPARRSFVKAWTADDLRPALARLPDADPVRGRAIAEEASCLICHSVGGEGGLTGPAYEDVVGRHVDADALLTHVLEPSEEIAEGYQMEILFLNDGRVMAGFVVEEDRETVTINTDPYKPDPTVVARTDIQERRTSELSAMPEGLLWTWEQDEILDLLAWLESLREQ